MCGSTCGRAGGDNTWQVTWDQALIMGILGKFMQDGGFFQAHFNSMKEDTLSLLWSLMKTIFCNGHHPSITGPCGTLEDDGTILGPLNGLVYIGSLNVGTMAMPMKKKTSTRKKSLRKMTQCLKMKKTKHKCFVLNGKMPKHLVVA